MNNRMVRSLSRSSASLQSRRGIPQPLDYSAKLGHDLEVKQSRVRVHVPRARGRAASLAAWSLVRSVRRTGSCLLDSLFALLESIHHRVQMYQCSVQEVQLSSACDEVFPGLRGNSESELGEVFPDWPLLRTSEPPRATRNSESAPENAGDRQIANPGQRLRAPRQCDC